MHVLVGAHPCDIRIVLPRIEMGTRINGANGLVGGAMLIYRSNRPHDPSMTYDYPSAQGVIVYPESKIPSRMA